MLRSSSVPFDFVRSHGLGNDYLVVDATLLGFELTPERVRKICDRHTGVGSDGVLAVLETTQADFGLRIFNPDGSEAEKSGNGVRIAAKYLYDHGYTQRTEFTIHTRGGSVGVTLLLDDERVSAVRVDMGGAAIDRTITSLTIDGESHEVVALSVGNPHCVLIVDDLARVDLARLGPRIEQHPAFPNRTNVQFVQILSRNDVRALIWERGAGHTLASGSSSCAVAAACFDKGLVDGHVIVHMEGGDLNIDVDDDLNLVMTGPVEEICSGCFSDELRQRLMA
ncbi:MAG TPA: diaminopimelate epimerase [Candidatus Kryptonia bacterium]|nr:diaminopimelate epimerase [Candidatus Kryptonia bacterium]